jgi:hypothetical protein
MTEKEPRLIKEVYEQIIQHPNFENLHPLLRCEIGGCTDDILKEKSPYIRNQNNQFLRRVWRSLYVKE